MDTAAYELELMLKATAGDDAALTVLIAQAHETILGRIRRKIPPDLRGSVGAEDVLQEAQIDVFQHIRAFEPRGAGSFNRWFATIAIRRLRNLIKAQRTLKRGGGQAAVAPGLMESSIVSLLDLMVAPINTPSQSAASHEAVDAVKLALGGLPEDYRQAVQLVYLEGHSVASVAERMNRSERAVHNLCYKAKERLRHVMGSRSRFLQG